MAEDLVLATNLAKLEILWWRSHHAGNHREVEETLYAQIIMQYPNMKKETAIEAAHFKAMAGAVHDLAEGFDSEELWSKAEDFMVRYYRIIVDHNTSGNNSKGVGGVIIVGGTPPSE